MDKVKSRLTFDTEDPSTSLKLIHLITSLPKGVYHISVTTLEPNVINARNAYYVRVGELAKAAGYLSRKDRELFKEQIKIKLGSESVHDMTSVKDISIKIEELNQFAIDFYDYQFPPILL